MSTMRKSVESIKKLRKSGKNVILFTGGTSFLGSRIAVELLERGHKLIFLMRSKNGVSVSQRLRQIFELVDYNRYYKADITVVDGQLDEDKFGVDDELYLYLLGQVDEIFHCASDTSFNKERNEAIERFNTIGTLNLLKLAEDGKCFFFHYVSTAYVAGKTSGKCKEEYVEQNVFTNVYEQSKLKAEKLILDSCKQFGIRVNIYRPSIVYGDSRTGKAIRFNAMYYFLRTVHYLKTMAERDIRENGGALAEITGIRTTGDGKLYLPIRIESEKDCFIDLIPVDYMVKGCVEILSQGLEGDIYHLVSRKRVDMKTEIGIVKDCLNIEGLSTVTKEELELDPKNAFEELYYSFMDIYRPYLNDVREFEDDKARAILEPKNIVCPILDKEILGRCIDYAIKVNWGKQLYDQIPLDLDVPESWAIQSEDIVSEAV